MTNTIWRPPETESALARTEHALPYLRSRRHVFKDTRFLPSKKKHFVFDLVLSIYHDLSDQGPTMIRTFYLSRHALLQESWSTSKLNQYNLHTTTPFGVVAHFRSKSLKNQVFQRPSVSWQAKGRTQRRACITNQILPTKRSFFM